MNNVSRSARYRREQFLRQMEADGRIPGGAASVAYLKEVKLRDPEIDPHSREAFQLLAAKIPGFTWEVRPGKPWTRAGTTYERSYVHFTGYPTVGGQQPSLADLVRNETRPQGTEPYLEYDPAGAHYANMVAPLRRLDGVGDKRGGGFGRLLLELPAVFPAAEVMEVVAIWLTRAMAGEPSTVCSGVCPDYATDATNDPSRPRVYTFNGLGSAVGLVAGRVAAAVPKLWEFCRTHRLPVKFVVGIGDFEADSEDTLQRVGLTKGEFLARLRLSQEAFRQSVPAEMLEDLETPLITEVDRSLWDCSMAEARSEVSQGRFTGALQLKPGDLERVARARTSLYQRWYGGEVDGLAVLARQAPEYMSMGTLFDRSYPNVLYLGGDAAVMSPFIHGLGARVRPVIYLRGQNY